MLMRLNSEPSMGQAKSSSRHLSSPPAPPCKARAGRGAPLILMKPKPREVKKSAQGHTAKTTDN